MKDDSKHLDDGGGFASEPIELKTINGNVAKVGEHVSITYVDLRIDPKENEAYIEADVKLHAGSRFLAVYPIVVAENQNSAIIKITKGTPFEKKEARRVVFARCCFESDPVRPLEDRVMVACPAGVGLPIAAELDGVRETLRTLGVMPDPRSGHPIGVFIVDKSWT